MNSGDTSASVFFTFFENLFGEVGRGKTEQNDRIVFRFVVPEHRVDFLHFWYRVRHLHVHTNTHTHPPIHMGELARVYP